MATQALDVTAQPATAASSKARSLFTKRLKQVATLRQKIIKTQLLLDHALDGFHRDAVPILQRLATHRVELTASLHRHSQSPIKLSKFQLEKLRLVIHHQLNEACNAMPEPSDALKALFQEIEGVTLDQFNKDMEQVEFERFKDNMSAQFNAMGVEIDLDDIALEGSQAEILAKIAERVRTQAAEQQAAPHAAPKPPKLSKKQLNKQAQLEAAQAVRNQTLAALYKRLALVLHPDLEQDPARKLHKEELMKQLTAAKEKADLHTLLRLEVEWLAGLEGDAADKAADAKLNIYNEALKAQIDELNFECGALQHQPRYLPLLQIFSEHVQLSKVRIPDYVMSIQDELYAIVTSIALLQGPRARHELLAIINSFELAQWPE